MDRSRYVVGSVARWLLFVVALPISPLVLADSATGLSGVVIKCPYVPPGLAEIPTCQGLRATCVGTEGSDLIWGTEDDDVIVGGGGDDVIHGDAGDDTICGGPGNDVIHGARGEDALFGEEGSDVLFGARDEDVLFGGPGDHDVLWGGPGLDNLDGGDGVGDLCLQQRDLAEVNVESCEVIYPPIGFDHDREVEIPPGIVDLSHYH